jgi:hypothetical protein
VRRMIASARRASPSEVRETVRNFVTALDSSAIFKIFEWLSPDSRLHEPDIKPVLALYRAGSFANNPMDATVA